MNKAHGADAANRVFEELLAQCHRVSSVSEAFNACIHSAMLYGYSQFTTHFEPSFMASLRMQSSGVMKFLLVPASTFAEHLEDRATWDAMREFMSTVSEADAKQMAESGVNIYHGKLQPNQVLGIPPAYFMACTPEDGTPVIAGIREALLPKLPTETHRQHFQKLLAVTADGTPMRRKVEAVLDVLVVAAQAD